MPRVCYTFTFRGYYLTKQFHLFSGSALLQTGLNWALGSRMKVGVYNHEASRTAIVLATYSLTEAIAFPNRAICFLNQVNGSNRCSWQILQCRYFDGFIGFIPGRPIASVAMSWLYNLSKSRKLLSYNYATFPFPGDSFSQSYHLFPRRIGSRTWQRGTINNKADNPSYSLHRP